MMRSVRGQKLQNTIIQMDRHHYEDCTFTRCVLVFSGKIFSWMNCQFVDCRISFEVSTMSEQTQRSLFSQGNLVKSATLS